MLKLSDDPPADGGRIDKRVAQYIMLRDQIKQTKERHKAELAEPEAILGRLAGELQAFLDRTGQESARTTKGTVTTSVRYTAVCSDPDQFIDFVRENDLFELIDRRANAPACRDYAKEHGVLPPGVKINAQRIIGVRAP